MVSTSMDQSAGIRHVPQAVLTVADCAEQLGVRAVEVMRAVCKRHLEATFIQREGPCLVVPALLSSYVGGGCRDLLAPDINDEAGWYVTPETAESHVAPLRQAAADWIDTTFPGKPRLDVLFESPSRHEQIVSAAWEAVEAANPAAMAKRNRKIASAGAF